MEVIDTEDFRRRLLEGNAAAWQQLDDVLRERFRGADFCGQSAEDFVQIALINFSASLAAGKVKPELPLMPYVCAIARNARLGILRKEKNRADIIKRSSSDISRELCLAEEGDTPGALSSESHAREQLAAIMEGFRQQGHGMSFKFLQALFLTTDDLGRAWNLPVKRTVQDRRKKLLAQAIEYATRPWRSS